MVDWKKVLKERKWCVMVFFLVIGIILCVALYNTFNGGVRVSDAISDKVRGDLYYIRGILNKRFKGQVNDIVAMELLVAGYKRGVGLEVMMAYAKAVKSWNVWYRDMSEPVEISAYSNGIGIDAGSFNAVGLFSGDNDDD